MQIPNGWRWRDASHRSAYYMIAGDRPKELRIVAGAPVNNVGTWIGELYVHHELVKRWVLTAHTAYGACTQARLWHEQVPEGIYT